MSMFDYRLSGNNVVNVETDQQVATISRLGEFLTLDGRPLSVRKKSGSNKCDVYVSGYHIGEMNAKYLR